MTTCRRCKAEIHQRYVGAMPIWRHTSARQDLDHQAVPAPKVSPSTESEQRAAWGDR